MNLPLYRLPTSNEALDALIKKVEEQRAHLTPVDSTPKETVPSDTTLNSPSKIILKKLRLKTDRKRLIGPVNKGKNCRQNAGSHPLWTHLHDDPSFCGLKMQVCFLFPLSTRYFGGKIKSILMLKAATKNPFPPPENRSHD
ncbi:hypothetical protein TNCV_3728271 [Trichonephila clavipes]|nr:hypothetical protein TNCV_3728271 [Trichonephila clavipes]